MGSGPAPRGDRDGAEPAGGSELGRASSAPEGLRGARPRRVARTLLLSGLVVLMGLGVFACYRETQPPEPSDEGVAPVEEPRVRILLVEDAEQLELDLGGAWTLEPEGDAARPVALEDPGAVRIRFAQGEEPGLLVEPVGAEGSRSWGFPGARALCVRPAPHRSGAPPFGLDGRRYRGELRVAARPGGRLRAVNYVGVEAYLPGVIGHEMPLGWSDPALHAQAIASRTYAIRSLKEGADWDMTADTRSQVYRGVMDEDARARALVEATRGMVVTHDGELVTTYFHSTCGGDTVPAEWIFPWVEEGGEPLSGTTDCPCQPSKYYRWTERVDLDGAGGLVLELPVEAFDVAHHPRGRYVREVTIVDATGEPTTLTGWDARRAFGLRSYAWDAELGEDGRTLTVQGRGWGHGVGMCQFGAEGRSKQGLDAEQVLGRAYPGTRVESLGY